MCTLYSDKMEARFCVPIKKVKSFQIYRYTIYWLSELIFHIAFSDQSPLYELSKRFISRGMGKALGGDKDLLEALTPTYKLGCKRITPSPAYLQGMVSS